MIAPAAVHARAHAVMAACGGEPNNWRVALTDATPEVKANWAAYQALDALFHAREYMRFIRHARHWPVARFAHHYRPHRQHQRIARSCVRSAARLLLDAERLLAMRELERKAA